MGYPLGQKRNGGMNMFSNIGRKIQIAGKVFCWLGILGAVLGGVAVWYTITTSDSAMGIIGIASGILTAILGALLSWVGSFTMVGFGKLVENSEIIADNIAKSQF